MNAPRLPLVLLHGWGFPAAVWDSVRPLLAPRWDLDCPALPGYAGAADAPASLDDSADRLAADLPATPGGVVLGGWSLGAMLAMTIARRHPEKVCALILIAATPRFLAAPDWTAAIDAATLNDFERSLADAPDALRRRFAALINQGDANARAIRRTLLALIDAAPVDAATLATGLAQLRHGDLRPDLSALPQPTLLIHGARDPLMPLAAAEWLAAALPDATLTTFPASAHAPFLADPAAFAAALDRFAQRLSPVSGTVLA